MFAFQTVMDEENEIMAEIGEVFKSTSDRVKAEEVVLKKNTFIG